jgi:scyllo-inosose 3-dehydrogenase
MIGLFCQSAWEPKKGYKLSEYELATHKALQSSQVWKNPVLMFRDDIPEPVPGPRDVLIQIKACGICGSDLHFIEQDADGYMVYPGHTRMNIVLGHELSGVVVEAGKDVQDIRKGDPVCVEEMVWCGECTPCRNGFPNQCRRLEEIGVTQNGGFAPYVCAPAKVCWKLDQVLAFLQDETAVYEYGALVEPSSVAYNAIFERGQGFRPGAYAAIFGGGPIGLLSASLIKTAGAAKVILFEIQEKRTRLAKIMGADHVLNPQELAGSGITPSEAIMELTHGSGADVLLEAAGVPNVTMPEMFKALAVNGRIIQTAMSGVPVPLVFPSLQARAGQIFGSVGHSGNGTFENVIRLMAAGRYDPRPIISDRYSLRDGMAAFEKAKERDGAKVMIKP